MRARRRHAAVPLLATLVVIGLAAGCAILGEEAPASRPAPDTGSTPRPGGRLVVGTAAESDGFLPSINRWGPSSFVVARAVYDPLATVDDQGVARPYLAESFEPNEDYTRWTIRLRQDVTFHDGKPLDAEALQIHFEATQRSEVAGAAIAAFERFSSPDPLTFVIDLDRPWAHLPTVMASQVGYIPSPAMYEEGNVTAPSNPIGTGPFEFTEWVQGERFTADRNAAYWRFDEEGRQLPYLSQVEFRPVPDDVERSNRLRSGELDVLQTQAYSEISSYLALAESDPDGRIRSTLDQSQAAEAGVVLNTESGVFTDRSLRLAAAYAVDRQELIDDLFDGYYDVANGPFTGDSRWGASSSFPTYFPERAQKLVEEWRSAQRGRSAPVIRFTTIAGADSVPVAQKLAAWWTEAGFKVEMSHEEERVGTVTLVYGRADAVLLRHWDRPDPDGLYHFLSGDNAGPPETLALNFPRYRSTVVDDALETARATADDDARRQEYQKIWEDFAQNVPVLWLFHAQWAIAHQNKVRGLGETPLPEGGRAEPVTFGAFYLTAVWVD